MNRFMRSVEIAACCSMLGAFTIGCGDKNPGGATNPTELEGTWVGHLTDDTSEEWIMTFSGNLAIVKIEGVEAYRGTFSLNTSTNPKQIDCVISASDYNAYIGETTHGIYQMDGTTLLFAGNEPGDPDRPTSFTESFTTMVVELQKQ